MNVQEKINIASNVFKNRISTTEDKYNDSVFLLGNSISDPDEFLLMCRKELAKQLTKQLQEVLNEI